MHNLI